MTERELEIINALSAPFNEKEVYFRVGPRNKDKTKGMPLAYIDARDVMRRLDEVVGPWNWQDSYHGAGQAVICELTISLPDGRTVSKSDGASQSESGGGPDDGIDASKSAVSNAFKRAAVKFGIGRYLYYAPNQWYPMEGPGWFNDSVMNKIRLDFGAWQRHWFGETVDRQEAPQREPERQAAPARGNVEPASETDYGEFYGALTRANAARREERLPPIVWNDVKHELKLMNYRVDDFRGTNWKDLKQLGRQALLDITRELDNRPCLIGSEVPF